MTITKRQLDKLRSDNWYCSMLTNAQADELLRIFGEEPAPEPPYIWLEEDFWYTVKKMVGE